jgi:hypothetical protein
LHGKELLILDPSWTEQGLVQEKRPLEFCPLPVNHPLLLSN